MDTTKSTTLNITSAQLEKLVEFIRRSGRPQNLDALTKRYIEILKEQEGVGVR